MRLRSIAPVVALAIVVAACLVTPGAFGGQPRGRLDQGVGDQIIPQARAL